MHECVSLHFCVCVDDENMIIGKFDKGIFEFLNIDKTKFFLLQQIPFLCFESSKKLECTVVVKKQCTPFDSNIIENVKRQQFEKSSLFVSKVQCTSKENFHVSTQSKCRIASTIMSILPRIS